jgi:phosphoglycerate transport regulatory protein PgtC
LKAATKAIHDAEAALDKKDNLAGRDLVKQARNGIAAMTVTEAQAASPEIQAAFTGAKEKTSRQAELEQQWATTAKAAYADAKTKADDALKLAK